VAGLVIREQSIGEGTSGGQKNDKGTRKVVYPLTRLCYAGVKFGLEKTLCRSFETDNRPGLHGTRPGSRSKIRGLEAEKA